SNFITTKLIKVIYALGLIIGAVMGLFYLLTAFRMGAGSGILALILLPIGYLLWAMYLRVMLEVLIVIFRISENVAEIAAGKRQA
ncbi:MAG: DUF4282 domain-containing protein, partial [Gemmatimonadales bacterium]